jgi:DNA-binding NarL/FixJ family response regulator
MMKKGKKRYEIADVLGVDAGSISRHVRNYLKDEIDKL